MLDKLYNLLILLQWLQPSVDSVLVKVRSTNILHLQRLQSKGMPKSFSNKLLYNTKATHKDLSNPNQPPAYLPTYLIQQLSPSVHEWVALHYKSHDSLEEFRKYRHVVTHNSRANSGTSDWLLTIPSCTRALWRDASLKIVYPRFRASMRSTRKWTFRTVESTHCSSGDKCGRGLWCLRTGGHCSICPNFLASEGSLFDLRFWRTFCYERVGVEYQKHKGNQDAGEFAPWVTSGFSLPQFDSAEEPRRSGDYIWRQLYWESLGSNQPRWDWKVGGLSKIRISESCSEPKGTKHRTLVVEQQSAQTSQRVLPKE